jgi:hypothetical protein
MWGLMRCQMDLYSHVTQIKCSQNICFSECDGKSTHFLMVTTFKGRPSESIFIWTLYLLWCPETILWNRWVIIRHSVQSHHDSYTWNVHLRWPISFPLDTLDLGLLNWSAYMDNYLVRGLKKKIKSMFQEIYKLYFTYAYLKRGTKGKTSSRES